MSEPIHDDDVIARLRAALDEVTAGPVTTTTLAPRPARTDHSAGRWIAIAAAVVLVVGAVAAIGVNLRNHDDGASSDTLAPDTSQPVSTATTPASPASWAVLIAQDLVPGDITAEQCCASFPAPGPATVMAWGAVDGLENGLLLLTTQPTPDALPTFVSNGFSAERVQELTSKVIPGSGLPFVLPDDGVTLLGVGAQDVGEQIRQEYTNDAGTVTVSVGAYRGQLTPLVTYGFHSVAIPGFGVTGYRATLDSGAEYVVWQMPNGQWATLDVPPSLADRIDGLVAALAPAPAPVADDTASTEAATTLPAPLDTVVLDTVVLDAGVLDTVLGEPLPPYETGTADAAVGMPAPQFGVDGKVAAPVAGVRTLVVLTASWCPHCKQTLPVVIGAETDGLPGVIAGSAGGGTKVVIVETASSPGSDLYTHDDLVRWGHVGPIYLDTDAGDGSPGDVATAYGTIGFPYFVLVDANGTVVRRATGEMDAQAVLDFVNG